MPCSPSDNYSQQNAVSTLHEAATDVAAGLQRIRLDWSLSELEGTTYADLSAGDICCIHIYAHKKVQTRGCTKCRTTSFILHNLGLHWAKKKKNTKNKKSRWDNHAHKCTDISTKHAQRYDWHRHKNISAPSHSLILLLSLSISVCASEPYGRHILFHLSVWMETDMFKTHNNGLPSTEEALCFVCLKHCIIS